MTNKILLSYLFFSFLLVFGCTKKEEDPNKLISGETSKIWRADRQTNAEGDKEKLTKEEKSEILQFYSNGTFSVNGTTATTQGKWVYDHGAKNLSLQFSGDNVSENFLVETLEDDKIKLKAPDGSIMTLIPKND